jgi:hypothetical protein
MQKLAIPLEDTPNSVLRRVFGLPKSRDAENYDTDLRVTQLLEAVGKLVGQEPQVKYVGSTYLFLSKPENEIAHILPQAGRLRIISGKRVADEAGIKDWDNELKDSRTFGGPSIRWYIPDGDDAARQRVATALALLWKVGSSD